jgi:uncharacterized protein YggE
MEFYMQHLSRTRSPSSSRFVRPLVLAAALALGTLPAMTASAQSVPAYVPTDGTLLNVSAQAEAKRVPDIATLSTGVVTRPPTPTPPCAPTPSR